jgi:bidirectional [NiFe] hydrogenase diaphorase subunit
MGALIDLEAVATAEQEAQAARSCRALVCTSTSCLSAGAAVVRRTLEEEVDDAGRQEDRPGRRHRLPGPVQPRSPRARRAAGRRAHPLPPRRRGRRAGHRDRAPARRSTDGPRRGGTARPAVPRPPGPVVLAGAGRIDPDRLEDYVAHGGYRALHTALHERTPADVLDAVERSGLRGRGGAGYPTGRKWRLLAEATGEHKVVVANGDEGDPGAFMDRTIMDSDPHRVLEGLTLAAYATGAEHGYLYVRAEYPLAIERLERAIRAAKKGRLLGRGILGTDFSFDVEVRVGAGAFVCGEETALLASIEGRRGTPRLRPPYPTERGLWGAPTMINNVETLANVPAIVLDGPEAFAAVGTADSPGTKVFALAGPLELTGLIEVPMGISLRTIVEEMAGGIAGGRRFKAAQTGGPSGGCIPDAALDTPVDYEHLRELGSMMGSGGLVVIDDSVSMPEFARFYVAFCRDESCGKCVPCRAGTVEMHTLLDRICEGQGRRTRPARLESLCHTVATTSLCGLGQSAPNPVLSTLEHFRDEYEALLRDGPATARGRRRLPRHGRSRRCTVKPGPAADARPAHHPGPARRRGGARPRGGDHPRAGAPPRGPDPDAVPPRGLSIHGGCRVCIVEVEGQHAAAAGVRDGRQRGHEIRSTAEQIEQHRRTIVELLFAEGSHVCAACVASGDCELQDLATRTGVDHVPHAMAFPRHEVDASHPRFVLDRDRCVLCTRCVRVCTRSRGRRVGHRPPRGRRQARRRDGPAVGRGRRLHLVRQVRRGVPDRGAVRARDLVRRAPRGPGAAGLPRRGTRRHVGRADRPETRDRRSGQEPIVTTPLGRRPRVATAWLGGCSGCHMSFLDLDEVLFDLAARADVVFGPLADVKEFPADVDLVLVEGAVANTDNLELARDIRANAAVVVSFGDCAVTGNITALRNALGEPARMLERVYVEPPTSAGPCRPTSCRRCSPRSCPCTRSSTSTCS